MQTRELYSLIWDYQEGAAFCTLPFNRSAHEEADTEEHRELCPGTRVRVLGTPIGLSLRSPTGTIVRPGEWDGYFVVRLDEPAESIDPAAPQQEVGEIVEYFDNLEVRDPFRPDAADQQPTNQPDTQTR